METLQVDRADGVVTVTMDRPEKRNAVDLRMREELGAVLRDLRGDDEARCVVLTGAGGAFSSGADLSGGGGGTGGRHQLAHMRDVGDVVLALHDLPQPTIAKVTGVAAGLGLNLALACDLVVASEAARFSEIFTARGLSVDGGGSYLLPRLVGMHRAKELVFLADIVSASDAAELGLVNRVVPADEVDALVEQWARRLAAGPPIALSLSKKLLAQSFSVTLGQALEAEAQAQSVNLATEDTREAILAFLERRDPVFRGR